MPSDRRGADTRAASGVSASGVNAGAPRGASASGAPDGNVEPGAGMGGKGRKKNYAFSKLRSLLKGKVSDEELTAAMRSARGHAGAKARKLPAGATELAAFEEKQAAAFAEESPPEWIPYMPTPGKYKHPRWGEIELSEDRIATFVKNFKDGVYQNPIPLDGEHDTKASGAFAWIRDMRQNEDGSADAKVEWTDRGVKMLEEKRYKFISPEWYDEWEDPATGKIIKDVAIGGAMTTRPFFKEGSLRKLAASEPRLMKIIQACMPEMCLDDDDEDDEDEESSDADELSDILIDMVQDGLDDAEIEELFKLALQFARAGRTAYARAEGMPMREPKRKGASMTDEKKNDGSPASVPHTGAGDSTTQTTQATESVAAAEMMKSLKEQNDQLASQNKLMVERVEAMEVADRHKRFTDEVMGRSDENNVRWFTPGDDGLQKAVSMTESVAKAFGENSEQFKSYIEMQRSAARAITAAALLSPEGSPAGATSTGKGKALAEIDAKVEAIRAATPTKTYPVAMSEVVQDPANADLYLRYKAEEGI